LWTTTGGRTCGCSSECEASGVQVLAHCLMTSHVHLVAVPSAEESLAAGIGRTDFLYTQYINRGGRNGDAPSLVFEKRPSLPPPSRPPCPALHSFLRASVVPICFPPAHSPQPMAHSAPRLALHNDLRAQTTTDKRTTDPTLTTEDY